MSNWDFNIRFSTGSTSWTDITSLVFYDSIEKSEQLVGSNDEASRDIFSFEMRHDSTMTNALFAAEQVIEFKVTEGSTTNHFRGIIDTGFSQDYGQVVGPIQVEAIDNGYKLESDIKTSFQFPSTKGGTQYMIFATSSTGTSIVHYLLSDAGYSSTDISSTGSIANAIQHVAETAGERTYKEYLDALLPEYGYTYRWDEGGVFQTVKLRSTSTGASHTFGSSNVAVSPPLTRTKTLFDIEGVEVEWSELRTRNNVYLFSDVGELDDATWNSTSDLLQGNTYYPAGGNARAIYQEYDPKTLKE